MSRCATKGKPLIPPKTIQHKYQDWKNFLVKRLTGARTLPTNFYKVTDQISVLLQTASHMTTPGGPRECAERVQGRDEAGGGGQDEDQPGAGGDDG